MTKQPNRLEPCPLADELEKALPLLDNLTTGQDCEDYAFANGNCFQAMTYCPQAFEALRCIPEVLTALRAQPADVVEARPVAWRTEYRDVYQGRDTGWHFSYSTSEPNPLPPHKDIHGNLVGHRNKTPLYKLAALNPAASDRAEKMREALEEIKRRPCLTPTSAKKIARAALSEQSK